MHISARGGQRRIDLHQHSKAAGIGDGEKLNFNGWPTREFYSPGPPDTPSPDAVRGPHLGVIVVKLCGGSFCSSSWCMPR